MALNFSFIATALITSIFDYCNSLLYNIASKDILNLQCVQNCLNKVATRSTQFFHSIPLLKSFHWQPHIIYKLSIIAYQTLSSGERSYLFSILSLAPKPRFVVCSQVKTHALTRAVSVDVPIL